MSRYGNGVDKHGGTTANKNWAAIKNKEKLNEELSIYKSCDYKQKTHELKSEAENRSLK